MPPPFLRPEYTLGADGHNRKQAARHRSVNKHNATCVWKRSSTNKSKFGRAVCRFICVRRGHAANQTGGESSQQSGHGRASAGRFEKTVGTTTHRVEEQRAQQPPSKRLESARGAPLRAQRRAEEAKVGFTLAQTVKEQADLDHGLAVALANVTEGATRSTVLKVTHVEPSRGFVAWQALVDGNAPKSSNDQLLRCNPYLRNQTDARITSMQLTKHRTRLR